MISIDKGNLQINGKDADQWLEEKNLQTLGKENTDKIVSMLNQNLEKSGYLQYPSRLDKVVNDVVNKKTINACLKQIYKNFQNSGHNIDTRQTEVNLDNVNFGEEQIFMDVKIDGQSVKFAYNHQTGELVMEDFKDKIQGKNSSSEELKSGITIATLLNYDNLHSNVSGLAMEALGDLSDDLNQNSEKRFEDLPKNLNKEIDEMKAYSNSLFADENDTVSYFLTQNTSAQNSATKILQSLPQQFNGENLEELGNVLKDKFRMLTSTESRQYEKTISNFCDMAKSLQNQPLGNYDGNYISNKEVLKLVESKGNDLFLGVLKDLKPNELSKFLSFVEKEQQFPNSKDENSYSLNEEKIRETYDKFFVKKYIEKAEEQIMQMA